MTLTTRLTGFAAASCLALPCLAVPVTPGGATVALPGTTLVAHPEYAGAVLADTSAHWVSAIDPQYGFPGAEGSLESIVVRESGTGVLDFYWRIFVTQPSYPAFVPLQLMLGNLSLASFLTGATFDADYRLDNPGSTAPTGAFSTGTSSFTYQFSGSTFGPGSSTFQLLLHSNATSYDTSAIANLGVSSLATFAPVAAVPEPGTWWLMLGGIAAMAAVVARRSRAAA